VPSPAPAQRQPPAAALRQYAADALQQLFGDLEAVWASADNGAKQAELLSLPFEALKALLADRRTCVASEKNTVAHTVARWVGQYELGSWPVEPLEALLKLVRVASLTPHYARTVFCECKLALKHLSFGQLAVASMAPLIDNDVVGVEGCEHWFLPPRPSSTLAFVLEWSPRLAELEACVASLPAEGDDWPSIDGPKGVVWQGWPLYLQMDCKRGVSGGLTLGAFLAVKLPCRTAGALIERSFEAVAVNGGRGIRSSTEQCVYTGGLVSCGKGNFFRLGKSGGGGGGSDDDSDDDDDDSDEDEDSDNVGAALPKDWAGIEAALRAKGLVHGEGGDAHLKLRCKVVQLD
jgi:hypothetical protein